MRVQRVVRLNRSRIANNDELIFMTHSFFFGLRRSNREHAPCHIRCIFQKSLKTRCNQELDGYSTLYWKQSITKAPCRTIDSTPKSQRDRPRTLDQNLSSHVWSPSKPIYRRHYRHCGFSSFTLCIYSLDV